MKADIAFGQYCEGNSFLHRLDPRWKIIFAIFYIVIIFLAKNIFSFALLLVSMLALAALSKIRPRILLRGLRPILFIIAFTAIINIFWLKGDTLLVDWHFIHIYLEGIINAFLIVARVLFLVAGTSIILSYTTTPIALTDGIEQLLAPLAKIKLPVHEFSMMIRVSPVGTGSSFSESCSIISSFWQPVNMATNAANSKNLTCFILHSFLKVYYNCMYHFFFLSSSTSASMRASNVA